jgi:2'-5' RNA ligase
MTCTKPERPDKSSQAGHWPAGREDYQWNVLPGTREARQRLISQYRELADWPDLVLVHADQMHVAVQQLGSVSAITGTEIARISRQIRGRCGGLRPFPVTAGRAEAWETGVACPVRPGYLLRFLRQVITDVTQEVTRGLPDPQCPAYYPHLTVARAIAHVDQEKFRAWMSDCEAAEMTFQITGLVLTAEQHNRREITRRVIDEVPLTGGSV